MKNSPKIKTILYASDLGGGTRPVFFYALVIAKKVKSRSHYGSRG